MHLPLDGVNLLVPRCVRRVPCPGVESDIARMSQGELGVKNCSCVLSTADPHKLFHFFEVRS